MPDNVQYYNICGRSVEKKYTQLSCIWILGCLLTIVFGGLSGKYEVGTTKGDAFYFLTICLIIFDVVFACMIFTDLPLAECCCCCRCLIHELHGDEAGNQAQVELAEV